MNDVPTAHLSTLISGYLCSDDLITPTWFKQAGLINVGFKTFLSERHAPLRSIEREFFGMILNYSAQTAENVDLPEQDMKVWRELANFDSPGHILKHPDFYFREGHIVVIGQVPES